MKKLIYVILSLALFSVIAIADTENNDNCNQTEQITEMHNKTGNYNRTETGQVQNGDDDYYYFTIPQNGTLAINYASDANTDLRIKSGGICSATMTRPLNNGKSYSGSISINADETVYVMIKRRAGIPNYSLGLSFTASVNHAPIISPSSMTKSIAENVTNGTSVMDVNATDSDGDAVTYGITSGNASGTFAINSSSGLITIANNTNLNYITTPSYALTVSATDGSLSSTGTVNVTVTAPIAVVNNGERPFAIRNPVSTRNLKGSVKVIGNTVLCAKNSSGNCYDYAGTDSNAELDLKYIDVDGTTYTYNNSSQAKLDIPATATIKWAGIYTQGYISNSTNVTTIGNILKEAVYVTVPSVGTIASAPSIIDIYPYSTKGYTYDTYAYLPSLIGKKGANVNGWIMGANIKAIQGRTFDNNDGLGNFGAWTLVVIYEESSETLKNISVYDGYRKVANETNFTTVDIPISGFIAPNNGVVNSTLSLFAGEGDKSITGDKLYASNLSSTFIGIETTNAFSSITTGFEANPSYTNTQGIDIQNYQIGVDGNATHPQIIGNNQKNTTIRLTTTGDSFFPSMAAFSTELYVPDMCYEEKITLDGEVPTAIYAGDTLDFEVLISNKSAEPATKVAIKRVFNNEFEYERASTFVKYGSTFQYRTDNVGDDVVTYSESENTLSLNMGTGATTLSGGTILKDQNETFRYQFNPQADGNITNAYMVTYKDDSNISGSGSIVYSDTSIGKCSDRNITFTVIPILPSGKVRIVEKSKNWNDYNGRLFTKIVNKATQYDILFATNDTGTTLTSGKIKKLEIVNIENISSPVVIATPINSLTTIPQRLTVNVTHLSAYKRLQFKITLEDDSIATSNDFSVRPADFTGTITGLWAGEALSVVPGDIRARDNGGISANLYSKALDLSNITSITIEPSKTCSATTKATLIESLSMNLTNGQSTSVSATFKDIGKDIILKVVDSNWTATSDDIINGDCITGNGSNSPDANGRFGCNIEGNITVTIQPYELNITDANFTASTNQPWLYDANVSAMYVSAHATVQANNKLHQPLANFTASCYAQPVDLSFYYDVNNTNSMATLSYDSATLNTQKTFSDINKTITIPSSSFITASASASADYRFNVDRAYNIPLSPIDIALKEVKVTSTTVAKNENNATQVISFQNDSNKTKYFYYGRIKTKDIVTDKTNVTHFLHVEVYSPTPLNNFYQNTLNWYINANDDNTTILLDANFSENKGFSNNQPSASVTVLSTGSFSDGVVKFNINNSAEEQGSIIHVGIPSWLWNSSISDYNNSVGASCASHPCFDYKYVKDKDTVGIKSGTFKGSTIGNDYNASYQKSGVKTFR